MDDNDDYMTMSFADPAPDAPETSLQRRRRERLAAQERGRPKSKAELEAEAAAARERGLARSLFADRPDARHSKGLAMMTKMGFRPGSGLGKRGAGDASAGADANTALGGARSSSPKDGSAGTGTNTGTPDSAPADGPRTEPIALVVKVGRGGIGLDGERKRKAVHAAHEGEEEGAAAGTTKRAKPETDPLAYRDRVRREQEEAHLERQIKAAMGVAERLDEQASTAAAAAAVAAAVAADRRGPSSPSDGNNNIQGERREGDEEEKERQRDENERVQGRGGTKAKPGPPPPPPRPLKSLPVLYRGLVRAREAAERERRIRREMETRLRMRGPVFGDDGDDDDGDDNNKHHHHHHHHGELDADDKLALGRGFGPSAAVGDEELDDDDAELDAFEALAARERLARLVAWLRARHRYCFWCKGAYDDPDLDGCPGETEQDHE